MVKAWKEIVTIPTYEVGTPEQNPMFLEKRVYQGSSGVVYPYPVIESISDEKVDKDWHAVWLENEYIKVMILPELGGRVQMAYDKIKQRHFVYYNHVIKPALVGLAGPWISGGIEFNWPQHHRPSTYMPVDSTIVENKDGSVTVWVNEMERMFHQKGMAGFTLRPGCAYLEIQGRVSNRTPLPQTFLWWANPAVEVNDAYQSVFPPDVNAVFDHGKRAVSSFPIATGTYYKMDYSAGVDISNYKNIYVPTSYMAVNSKYNFEGGYENDTKGGMLHVASHHLSPGKKQWTWGNGNFGRAWDRNLTDEVTEAEGKTFGNIRPGFRPYIELMAGVYTENQPDFTWLMPYEEKQFVQYFMPYREVGIVKQASKDFILNIDETDDGVCFKVLATSKKEVRITLEDDKGHQYYNKVVMLTPEAVLIETIECSAVRLQNLTLTVGNLRWQAEPDEIRPIPDAAEAALSPQDTKTNDQLYLTGLHLEQYRHATWSALDYYEEALRRDPNDVRCLTQTGLWYLRRGRFDKAEGYLRKAVKTWQKRNPNPYDGEAIFYLALCMKYQYRPQEAYELFWKSTWNKAWADAGYYQAACISVSQGRYDDALDELERCLISNTHNHQARALKATVLRQLGRKDEALAWIRASYEIDHFNYVCMMEEYLLTGNKEPMERMISLMHNSSDNYDETALEYCAAGLNEDAMSVWQVAIEQNAISPMTYYYMGRYAEAEQADSSYCFPNRLEAVLALEKAKEANPSGAKAPYYLGCLYYDKRQYDVAIENWELSAKLDPRFPSVWRNLALARFNKQNRQEEALEYMERAFHLDESDARTLMELDQLYKRLHRPHQERLNFLQKYPDLIVKRDDLVLEEATLLNQLGRYEESKAIIDNRIFHPWEGGEGKVSGQYQICRVEMAKQLLKTKSQFPTAQKLLEECLVFPQSLGEGKLYGAQDNDFLYFLGRYEEGTVGPTEPAAAMYYNDAKPDKIFYAGLCYRKLGQEDKARGLFNKLINYGKQHIYDKVVMDYFAVSLPDLLIWEDSLDMKNLIHCKYMLALGYYGMGNKEKALKYLAEVETLDNNHQGVQQLRSLIDLDDSCAC
jgi:tetratricopeptide (TPR) repeat protein